MAVKISQKQDSINQTIKAADKAIAAINFETLNFYDARLLAHNKAIESLINIAGNEALEPDCRINAAQVLLKHGSIL